MTIIAELKALIDTVPGLTLVFALGENQNPDFPYVTILDPISNVPALQGDARTLARRRLIQVDIWQAEGGYSEAIVDQVVEVIDGAGGTLGLRYRVVDSAMVPDDEDVVHHALTVSTPRLR